MKKLAVVALGAVLLAGCASTERAFKDFHSDLSGGLDRKVNVYDYQGDLIASYEGKIDIADDQEDYSKVKFDVNGKRYMYFNAIVEVIEK